MSRSTRTKRSLEAAFGTSPQFSHSGVVRRLKSKKPRDLQTGHYKGRLPAPKRAARAGKYALYGHRAECERYIANRASSDVVYVGAQVAPAGSIGQSVGVAFLRKVMKQHYHIEYSSTEQQLRPLGGPGAEVADYFPVSIKFWRKTTPSTLGAGPTYDIGATYSFPAPGPSSTVASFGAWFNEFVFNSTAFGTVNSSGLSNDRVELHAYQFIQLDSLGGAGSNLFVNQAVVPLEGQYLSAYSVVRIHIQNVTVADGTSEPGAVYQTTRIDANPLKGVLMRFRSPTPMVKDAAVGAGIDGSGANNFGWTLQSDMNGDGLIMPGNNPPTGPWTQLPSADMFKNCVGLAHITLEPGDIKDYSLNFKFSGTLQALMKGFQTSYTDSNGNSYPLPSTLNKQLGNSFMFALEKRMPTGPAAVTVNIHYENYYGAVFGGRRKTPMVREARSLGATSVDNNA